MISADQSAQIKELLQTAQTILVIVGKNPTTDQAASAAALVAAIQAQSKSAILLAPRELQPPLIEALPSLPEVHTELGNRDLSISFEYQPDAVDKVSYHIDEQNNRFYLVIKPQKGRKPLDQQTVEFSYTGAEADLIFLIGVHEFEALEQLYFGYEQLYADTTIVTFNTFEPAIGTVKLNTSGSSSLSEAMALLIQELELSLTSEAATQLLTAIEESTDSFRSLATTADTFEVVAQLLRFGARRIRRAAAPVNGSAPVSLSPSPTPSLAEALKAQGKKPPSPKVQAKKAGGLDYQPNPAAPRGG